MPSQPAGRMRWPLVPMIGTLACAPEWEVHSTTAGQGPFGGNLDVGDYQAGAVVYLTSYEPDFEALKRAPTKIVLAVGEEEAGSLAHRGGVAAAERLGTQAVLFPGGHSGFMGGEYGQPPGKPAEFAAKLREVLG